MNLSPKEDFRSGPFREGFNDLSGSKILHEAIKTALLHMQLGLPTAPDLATASSNHFRMEGARQLIGILLSLTDEQKIHAPVTLQNLNHRT